MKPWWIQDKRQVDRRERDWERDGRRDKLIFHTLISAGCWWCVLWSAGAATNTITVLSWRGCGLVLHSVHWNHPCQGEENVLHYIMTEHTTTDHFSYCIFMCITTIILCLYNVMTCVCVCLGGIAKKKLLNNLKTVMIVYVWLLNLFAQQLL